MLSTRTRQGTSSRWIIVAPTLLAVLVPSLVAPHTAFGQASEVGPPASTEVPPDPQTQARAKYAEGAAAYDRKEFGRAVVALAEADALSPHPVALKLALAAALRSDDALLGMTLVLRAEARAASPTADLVLEARRRFGPLVGVVRIVCSSEPPCAARVDAAILHGGDRLVVAPGAVEAVFEGNRRVVVTVTAGERVDLIEPRPQATAAVKAASSAPQLPHETRPTTRRATYEGVWSTPAPAPRTRDPLPRVLFWTGVVATSVLGGLTSVAWYRLDQRHDAFVAAPSDQARRDGEDADLHVRLLLGSTIALALSTAAVGLFWDRPTGSRRTK